MVVIVLIVVLLAWCWNRWKYRKLLRLACRLPTIRPTLPVFGHMLHSALRHKLNVRGRYKCLRNLILRQIKFAKLKHWSIMFIETISKVSCKNI